MGISWLPPNNSVEIAKLLQEAQANCTIATIFNNHAAGIAMNGYATTPSSRQLDPLINSVLLEVFIPLIPRFPQFQVMTAPTALIVDGMETLAITAKTQAIDVTIPVDSDVELYDIKDELVTALRAIIDSIIAAGDVYITYMPLMHMVVYDPATFTPKYVFRTRYATYTFKNQ